MDQKQMKEKMIDEIYYNVKSGLRTKYELRKCNCENCIEALRRLKESDKK